MKGCLTVRHAMRLPLLGIQSEPSPYLILDCDSVQYTTSICQYTRNPTWNHQLTVSASSHTTPLHFYVTYPLYPDL